MQQSTSSLIKKGMNELKKFEQSLVQQGKPCHVNVSSCGYRLWYEAKKAVRCGNVETSINFYVDDVKRRCVGGKR